MGKYSKKSEKKVVVRQTEIVTVKPKDKKAKQLADDWNDPVKRGSLVKSELLAGMTKFGEEKFGSMTVIQGERLKRLQLGIPIPFPVQYLIGRSRLPLSIAIAVSGPPGNGKTTFILELCRFFFLRDGLVEFSNNEPKFNGELAQGIFGGKSLDDYPFLFNQCESQEDWQSRFTDYIRDMKKRLVGTTERPGPGKTIPFALVVDGLTSVASIESIKNINTQGYASRAYAIEAGNNTRYLQARLQDLMHWPFMAIFGLHRKTRSDDAGNKEEYTPGGSVTTFLEAIEIVMSSKSQLERTAKFSARTFSLRVGKNSMESDDRFLQARVLYWKTPLRPPTAEEPRPPLVQRAKWDWAHATVKLLTADRIKPLMAKIGFHIESKSDGAVENLCWSKSMGVSVDKPISYADMGRKIEANPEVLKALRQALDISDIPAMTGDYEQQMSKLEAQNEEVIEAHERSAKDRAAAKAGGGKPRTGRKA